APPRPPPLPDTRRHYRSGKDAQDAREAIRPTSPDLPPAAVAPYLTRDELNIYTLVWNRFVACQMQPALYDTTSVDIAAGKFLFRASGQVLKSAGWLVVSQEQEETVPKAEAKEGEHET